jgi:hypothetical protein
MTKNPILDGLRETREQLLAESGGTLEGLVDRLQAEERASGRTIRETRRAPRCTEAVQGCVLSGDHFSSPTGNR